MVSVEAPITREPLVMLGEKLSEEGTSHSAMKKKKLNLALQPGSIPVPHSTDTHTNMAFAFRLAAEETPAAHGVVRVKGKA